MAQAGVEQQALGGGNCGISCVEGATEQSSDIGRVEGHEGVCTFEGKVRARA